MADSKRSVESLPKAAQRVSAVNQLKGFTEIPKVFLMLHKTLDTYEIANNTLSMLSVSSVVKSAEFGFIQN